MVKGTVFLIFFLAVSAAFLSGLNLGKKLEKTQLPAVPQPTIPALSPTPATLPTLMPTKSATESPTTVPARAGISIFRNKTCGFEFSYPGSYLQQKTVNNQSVIFSDPNDNSQAVAATCATEIPKPSVPQEKIEVITLDQEPATLYHDQSAKDGLPRDEVIVKHPTNNKEIMIAGYGSFFQEVLSSFKFVR